MPEINKLTVFVSQKTERVKFYTKNFKDLYLTIQSLKSPIWQKSPEI